MPLLISLFILLLFSPKIQSASFPSQAVPTRSGYLPIHPTSNSFLFYTFYEAQAPTSPLPQTPLLLWLQGGPGSSSMIGNFFELGPFLTRNGSTVTPNPFSWNRLFGLLFIENPIGTGFSTFTSPSAIPRNQSAVADDLIFAIKTFLLTFDLSFRSRPFYVTGEGYGGKYAAALGYYILKRNENINLQGVAIGNGMTHPVAQVATHADTAYFTGLISERQKKDVEKLQNETIRLVNEGNWSAATDARNRVLAKLENITGLATLFDYRRKTPYQTGIVATLMNQREVQEAIAAVAVMNNTKWEGRSQEVSRALHADVMKSAKFMVEELVKRSRVLLYQGMFDLTEGVVSNEAWIKEMQWEGLERFLQEERRVWRVDGEVAGQVQRWRQLTQVVVFGAGHFAPADQGRSTQAMIEGWVLQTGLFGGGSDGDDEAAKTFSSSCM